eukprot:TRINITY_DN6733_c0_g1_i1.p1 TRINITY_DN6733_c0_g1~~TRINITY_DN6733_c0_g1_i1.p1  ORF type:complete len:244 (-),score=10.41 TRINITY_DN6733_c0_g1_i1:163-894(-)
MNEKTIFKKQLNRFYFRVLFYLFTFICSLMAMMRSIQLDIRQFSAFYLLICCNHTAHTILSLFNFLFSLHQLYYSQDYGTTKWIKKSNLAYFPTSTECLFGLNSSLGIVISVFYLTLEYYFKIAVFPNELPQFLRIYQVILLPFLLFSEIIFVPHFNLRNEHVSLILFSFLFLSGLTYFTSPFFFKDGTLIPTQHNPFNKFLLFLSFSFLFVISFIKIQRYLGSRVSYLKEKSRNEINSLKLE